MFCGLRESRRAGPREAALAFGKEVLLGGRVFSLMSCSWRHWLGWGRPGGYKIFKIKLVTTYLGYKSSWCEGFGHTPVGWWEETWISNLGRETDKF